jgi:intergrase/recombinase
LRNGFLLWARARFNPVYVRDFVYALDKWQPVICSVEDIDRLFAGDFPGKRHLWFAVRNLLKYCGQHGWDKEWVKSLLGVMPPVPQSRPDNRVPKEHEVLGLLRALRKAKMKYQAFHNLILDSAVRPAHVVEILRGFKLDNLEELGGGVYKYNVTIERGEKHTFICFITEYTLKLIREMEDPISLSGYKVFQKRHKTLRPKLLQKFAYNMMRKSGVDRDIAEFISGRKPEGIGPKHYAELIMLSEEQYPKYALYLKGLREKV